uniref:BED-type domain-containing protein n=1 Tax=Anopheles dirus TaxID=7168 RepID=A0A182N6P6_9DIPT
MADRKVANIWYFFEQTDSADSQRCRLCRKTIIIKGRSTFSLKRHMDKIHPGVSIERTAKEGEHHEGSKSDTAPPTTTTPSSSSSKESVQKSMKSFVNVFKPLSTANKKVIDRKLLYVFCNHALPFRLVEEHDVKDLFATLCPNYSLPSRKTLGDTMLSVEYEDVLAKVQCYFSNAYSVCLTTDGWTDINNQSYLAATAHFIHEPDCKIKSLLLECGPFDEKHSSENIANWLNSIMDKFKITDKVCAIVTDNASNMKFYVNKDPVISSLALLGIKNNLKDKDWKIIEESSNILKFFDLITKEVSSEKTITLSKIKVIANLIETKLNTFKQNSNFTIGVERLIQNLCNGLEEKFTYINCLTVLKATILDPRFKKEGIENETDFDRSYKSLIEDMKKINSTDTSHSESTQDTVTVEKSVTESIWEDFDTKRKQKASVSLIKRSNNLELDNYLAEPFLKRTEDPLLWWHINKMVYPTLFKIMLGKLCIPASSVPCERVFSKAAEIESEKRNRLKSEKSLPLKTLHNLHN